MACGVGIPGPGGGTELSSTVYYADGTRAGVIDADSGYWLSKYVGSLIYSGEIGEESLDGIQTADGFIDCSNGISAATSGVTQLTVSDMRVNLKPCSRAEKGERCSVAIPTAPDTEHVRRGDKVFLWVEAEE